MTRSRRCWQAARSSLASCPDSTCTSKWTSRAACSAKACSSRHDRVSGVTSPVHHPPRPRETLDRCALRSQLRGDTMLGTAFPAARLLLVEQPGPWGQAGLRHSRFDAALAEALERRALAEGVRVQAIRRPGRTARGAARRWALVDTRDGHESIRWGSFAADADLLDVPLDGSAGTPDDAPLYLVCAHSRHDTCCALRGRPVAAALDALRPGRV